MSAHHHKPVDVLHELRRNALFTDVDNEVLASLAAHCDFVHSPKGERILSEGDASTQLFVLVRGRVGVFYSSPDGVEVLVKVFGDPAVFGEMELFFELPRLEYDEAFEDSTLLRVAGEAFLHFLQRNNDVCYRLLKDVSARLCIAANNERSLAFLDVETRMAGFFMTFVESFGVPSDAGMILDYPITYELIARCLGITSRSVERTMAVWLKQGWLKRSSKRYTVLLLDELLQRVDQESLMLYSKLGQAPHLVAKR